MTALGLGREEIVGLLTDLGRELERQGLRVSVPSARYLLALKVAAARVDRDADDIRLLAQICGVRTAQEILRLTDEVVGSRRPLLPASPEFRAAP